MDDCPSCRIVKGTGAASAFYEDDLVLGILDISPVNPGHAMVIPRRHAASLAELDEDAGRRIWTVAQRAAAAVRQSGLRCEGVNLFLADGAAAYQDVFHVHLHVIPRYSGDGFHLRVDYDPRPSRVELDRVAARIREAYERLWAFPTG